MNLVEYIRQDLEALLAVGAELPFKLTLTAMAKHYEVSLMPVRGAVDGLIQEGYLLKQPNGRLMVDPQAGERSDTVIERPERREDLEQEFLGFVIRRSLLGDEEFLREEATAERFDTGRSTVRRLLSRLAGAGFLEHVPRRGFLIRPYREKDMSDFIEIREVLECKALDLSREKLDRERLKALLDANRQDSFGEARLDNRLHECWIAGAENRYIDDFFRLHRPYYQALFDYATTAESVIETMARQHCEILEAVLDRDWGNAKRALRRHIRAQRPTVLRLIAGYREANRSTPLK